MIFQCVTLEGWSSVMVMLQKVFNEFAFLFFVPLVFIGAFFLLNLTLAVIKSKFTEEHNERKNANKYRGDSHDDLERKQKEKSRINRKIDSLIHINIKQRLFKILEDVRKRLYEQENKALMKRPMSAAGSLRREIFDDDDEK